MLDSKMSFLLGAAVPAFAFCLAKLTTRSEKPKLMMRAQPGSRNASPAGPEGDAGALSTKGESILEGMKSLYLVGWREARENAYHAESNPDGCIQLGLAENMMCFDVVEEWFAARAQRREGHAQLDNHHQDARDEVLPLVSLELADVFGRGTLPEIGGYQEYVGLPDFRAALANWMGAVYEGRVTVDPDKLITVGGCTAAVEILTFCLADPGDAILVPAPFYPGFVRDVEWRTGVKICTADCGPSFDFDITYQALDNGLRTSEASGRRVRAILLSSPSNPIGITYDVETLREILRFVRDRNLHLICDEIFAGCVFDAPAYVSILEILSGEDRDRVHVVYGLSKDIGLAGFRVGSIYTHNTRVREALSGLARFAAIPSNTQKLLVPLLADAAFAKRYLGIHRERLRKKQSLVLGFLDQAKGYGIRYVRGNAGVYVWVDMSGLLPRGESNAKAEEFLFLRFLYEVGLNMNCGLTCGMKEPGWFRLCFSTVGDADLRVGLERLVNFSAQCCEEKDAMQ